VYRVANWMAFSAFQWALSSGGETTVGTAVVCVAFDAIAQAIFSASDASHRVRAIWTRPGVSEADYYVRAVGDVEGTRVCRS
jgi:hypothetical protein